MAGANSVSVSLWPVADESTMKFMVGLYALVNEKGLSFDEAMNEMKRLFIHGSVNPEGFGKTRGLSIVPIDQTKPRPNQYSSPYYWAPFD